MDQERLRVAPAERFAGPSHHFDLREQAQRLRAEAHAGQHGHRQIALFARPPVTQVLFAFEAGGELASHAADGLVTILAVEGELEVTVEPQGEAAQTHQLQAPATLVLSPLVRHSVRSKKGSTMLLTIVLEEDSRR